MTWHIRLQIIHWHFTGLIIQVVDNKRSTAEIEIYQQWREEWQIIHTRGQTKVEFGILIEWLAFDTVNFVCNLSANTNTSMSLCVAVDL